MVPPWAPSDDCPWAEHKNRFLFGDPVFDSVRGFSHRRDVSFDRRRLENVRDPRVDVTLGSVEEFPLKEVLEGGRGTLHSAQPN